MRLIKYGERGNKRESKRGYMDIWNDMKHKIKQFIQFHPLFNPLTLINQLYSNSQIYLFTNTTPFWPSFIISCSILNSCIPNMFFILWTLLPYFLMRTIKDIFWCQWGIQGWMPLFTISGNLYLRVLFRSMPIRN